MDCYLEMPGEWGDRQEAFTVLEVRMMIVKRGPGELQSQVGVSVIIGEYRCTCIVPGLSIRTR
jgi:hypothetical protein